jgi:hypothetical protein
LHEYRDGEEGRDRRLALVWPEWMITGADRVGRDDERTAAVHHPHHNGVVMGRRGPGAFDDRGGTVLPDGPNRKLSAFAGEKQNTGRAGRARNHSQQDLGQAIWGARCRQRAHDLMRAGRIDSC